MNKLTDVVCPVAFLLAIQEWKTVVPNDNHSCPALLLRCPIKSSGLRFSSVLSTAATCSPIIQNGELSEWLRSVCNAAAPSARRTPGTATGKAGGCCHPRACQRPDKGVCYLCRKYARNGAICRRTTIKRSIVKENGRSKDLPFWFDWCIIPLMSFLWHRFWMFFVFEKIYCMSHCKPKLYVLKLTQAILETD